MGNRFSRTAAILNHILLALIVSACGRDALADQPKLDDILKAWESRQESVKSLRIAWTEERTDRRGSLSKAAGRPLRQPHAGSVPPEDTTLRSKCTLLVAGDRSCYSFFGRVWQLDRGELITRKYKSTFDGETRTSLWNFSGAGPDAQVATGRESNDRELRLVEKRPLAWYFWPLRPNCGGLARADLALSERTEELDGVVLAVLEEREASGAWWEYWIEPREGFLVRRACHRTRAGTVLWQIDVDYTPDASGVRLPSSWKLLTFDNGEQLQSRVGTVSELTVNPRVADADFEIELPEGAISFSRIEVGR